MAERYLSGTSLTRTEKEEWIDRLEKSLWTEFSDEFFVSMKKLTVDDLKKLHALIMEKENDQC